MKRAHLRAGLGAALALACSAPPTQVEPRRITDDVQPLSIGNETRYALLLHEGRTTTRVPVELPKGAELSFGYAVGAAVREEKAERTRPRDLAPVTLSLALLHEGGERTPIFEQHIDPRLPRERLWRDASADLSRWEGERVELEFSMRPDGDGVLPVAGFWDPTLHTAGARSSRPNLMIVSLDTLRARNVGAYGHERNTTPFLDELAAHGVLFENAITASVTTGPSHMSLFTGLYPVHHGMRTGQDPRRASAIPLAAWLRRAGYHTAAFTEDGYIIRGLGFGEGFSEYSEITGQRGSIPGDARVTFERARSWLARNRRQPFLLFVHTYQVHAPYRPPPETAGLFQDDGSPGTESAELRVQYDNYDREIRFVDQQLRELVGALDLHGLRDATTIVVLSDHGEEFGEHGYFEHGSALFEESLRVPLVFAGKDIPVGRRVAEQVSLIDVMPTLLTIAGVPVPAGLDGESLLPAMRGAELPDRTLFAEATAPGRWRRPFRLERWNPPLVAMRSQHSKLLVHRPKQGEAAPAVRFDLSTDALEHTPQPLSGPDLAAARAAADAYLQGQSGESTGPAPALDPELRERLEALGYVIEEPPAH